MCSLNFICAAHTKFRLVFLKLVETLFGINVFDLSLQCTCMSRQNSKMFVNPRKYWEIEIMDSAKTHNLIYIMNGVVMV